MIYVLRDVVVVVLGLATAAACLDWYSGHHVLGALRPQPRLWTQELLKQTQAEVLNSVVGHILHPQFLSHATDGELATGRTIKTTAKL